MRSHCIGGSADVLAHDVSNRRDQWEKTTEAKIHVVLLDVSCYLQSVHGDN